MQSKQLKISQRCLVNGVATDYVSVEERGLQYGDGLFETIACEKKSLQFWSSHFFRLQEGARRLGLVCPPESVLLGDVKRLLENFSDDSLREGCVIKIIITRGCSKRGYRVTDKNQLTRIVQLSQGLPERFFSDSGYLQSTKITSQSMAVLGVCKQMVSINPSLAGIKHLNRLENVLARNEWHDEYHEGLMLDANGNVIEGTMSNVFGVRDGQLFTPALDNSGVAGIIRANIIELAIEAGIVVEINNFSLDDVCTMNEIFICNSLLEIMPVSEISLTAIIHKTAWQLDVQNASLPITTKLNQFLQTRKTANAQDL